MLDDLKFLHQKDPQDALGIAEKSINQLIEKFDFDLPKFDVKNIVFAGMGGSALSAEISKTYPGYTVPFEIVRDYNIPKYVSSDTLFVASSYSGNTEETVSALKQAIEKTKHILIITSGGQLSEIATAEDLPIARIPSGLQPRYAVMYMLVALIQALEDVGLVNEAAANSQLQKTHQFLNAEIQKWVPMSPRKDNLAKQTAQELMGSSVVIYGGSVSFPAVYKWKISINENAKQVAWCNQYSEFNHNEFLGWTEQPDQKPYKVINLLSDFDHPRIRTRIDISEKLLSGKKPAGINIVAKGDTVLDQILYLIILGDFTSIYLALLNNVNPTPVEIIEKLKHELSQIPL